MAQKKRTKILVKRQVQHSIARRAFGYWCFSWLGVLLFASIWIAITEQPASSADLAAHVWARLGVAIMASFALVPLVYFDCIRHSHRFVGPIVRLKQQMDRAAEGEPVEPLRFRKNDHWKDLAASFNNLVATYHEAGSRDLQSADRSAPEAVAYETSKATIELSRNAS